MDQKSFSRTVANSELCSYVLESNVELPCHRRFVHDNALVARSIFDVLDPPRIRVSFCPKTILIVSLLFIFQRIVQISGCVEDVQKGVNQSLHNIGGIDRWILQPSAPITPQKSTRREYLPRRSWCQYQKTCSIYVPKFGPSKDKEALDSIRRSSGQVSSRPPHDPHKILLGTRSSHTFQIDAGVLFNVA